MKDKLFVAGLILYAVGFFVVCQFSNWQTCLGVIIMMWGDNLEQKYRHDNSQHDRQRL
jgi:hypothetical protein